MENRKIQKNLPIENRLEMAQSTISNSGLSVNPFCSAFGLPGYSIGSLAPVVNCNTGTTILPSMSNTIIALTGTSGNPTVLTLPDASTVLGSTFNFVLAANLGAGASYQLTGASSISGHVFSQSGTTAVCSLASKKDVNGLTFNNNCVEGDRIILNAVAPGQYNFVGFSGTGTGIS